MPLSKLSHLSCAKRKVIGLRLRKGGHMGRPAVHERKKIISIVTPCYNEEMNVTPCYLAVKELFEGPLAKYDYEQIFCDNASTDSTVHLLKGLAAQDPRVKVIVNARNFGALR